MTTLKLIIRTIWFITIFIVLFIGTLIYITQRGYFGELPNIYLIKNPQPKLSSEVYSEDSVLLGKFYYKFDRIHTSYKEISPHVIHTLIATEDERFYEHYGVDFRSLIRAIFALGNQGGASTITQQLAKNLFTEKSQRGFRRIFQKLKEWVIAVKLERNFSKEEILTLYLNVVPFGDNIYGIRNAALTFFKKKPHQLSIEEAAVLVGLLKSNTSFNPRLYPNKALQRRNIVLRQTFKNHYISKQQLDSLLIQPLELDYLKLNEKEGIATYFREHIRNELKTWIETHAELTGKRYNMYQDGLKIYTTINSKMQAYAEESVDEHISKMQAIFNAQIAPIEHDYWQSMDSIVHIWKTKTERYQELIDIDLSEEEIDTIFNKKIPMSVFSWEHKGYIDTLFSPLDSLKYYKKMLQVGALFVDPLSGKVKAWVGGVNYKVFKYDHIKTAKRQVGSTIKPLLYSLAMDDYGFRPQTLCSNVTQCFPETDTTEWCTQNNPGSRNDSITSFAEGIVFSLNNVSAFVLRNVTPSKFAHFLNNQLRIKSKIYPFPSLALGTSEISVYEMVRAYTVFPSNGVITDLQTISRIEDKYGRLISRSPTLSKQIVLSEKTAYSMSQIMQGTALYGTARRLRYVYQLTQKGEIAGKTGTTNDFSDAWFIGFNRNMLGGVWVGCEDKIISFQTSQGEGSSMALPIFGSFWLKCQKDKSLNFKPISFKRPLGVDSTIGKTIKQLSKTGLDAYLKQRKDSGELTNANDSIFYQFVLNDPYHNKFFKQKDSIDFVNDSLNAIKMRDSLEQTVVNELEMEASIDKMIEREENE